MANLYDYIHYLEINQQIGWIELNKRMKESLKNKWDGNLNSLTFQSGISGYFFVDNNVFHFKLNFNHIKFNIIAHSKQEADELCEKFRKTINLLFE